jgi:hypothetical protein
VREQQPDLVAVAGGRKVEQLHPRAAVIGAADPAP